MRLVRGLLLVRTVRQIRANKSGVYDNLLSEKDKKIIYKTIIDNFWYDYEIFKNCFYAIDKVEAKGNMEIWRKWGRMGGKETRENQYKLAIVLGNPKKSLEKFSRLRKLYYNFGILNIEESSDTHIILKYIDFDPQFKIYFHFARGWLEKFLEQSIGNKVISKFLSKSWKGDKFTKFSFTWN